MRGPMGHVRLAARMDTHIGGQHVNHEGKSLGLRADPRARLAVAIGYRWATLLIGLLVALLASARRPGSDERLILVVPILVAVLITIVAAQNSRQWLRVLVVIELLVGATALAATGGNASPLILYMTAPGVTAAVLRNRLLTIALALGGAAVFIGAAILGSSVPWPGSMIENVAMVFLVPMLTLALVETTPATSTSPELMREDLAVASALNDGLTYKEIAEVTGVTPETAKVQVARLYRRLGVRSRDEAVALLREHGSLDVSRLGEQ